MRVYKVFSNLTLIFLILSCLSCTRNCNSSRSVDSVSCERTIGDTVSDTIYNRRLLLIAQDFEPQHVGLNASIIDDTLFSNTITEAGINTIRKQTDYETFLLIIFLKLYQHHLSSYHQGYDLKEMREGFATFLIDDLFVLMDVDIRDCEMLNSGYVVDFVSSTEAYNHNTCIVQIVDSINSIDILQYF